ncbi:pentapeptide repeat-containing protein [Floridanema evergladense]|uniref:Pentapeptide repeat-containing protein n=1 Tax=Floridaenema evergladense BLCC-F167 TaxID=3153639 RepID=A0ABV4WFU7_9CYAN
MARINHKDISLYEEAKAGFNSLIKQTVQVGTGFLLMLLVTGGKPPAFTVALSVVGGIAFVAWSEQKRMTNPKTVASVKNHVAEQFQSQSQGMLITLKAEVNSPSKEDTENLSELVEKEGLNPAEDLVGMILVGVKGVDCDLRGFNLSEANLFRANLSRADLSYANLSGTDLSGANLSRADLSYANLSSANLSRADLSYANLSGANLSGSYLSLTKINEETKLDSKWRLVWEIVNQEVEGRDLSNADLSNANLKFAKLNGARLVKAQLQSTELSNTKLAKANLIGADLTNARLLEADLTDADLSGTKVKNAVFGDNLGIFATMKRDLIERGAIFVDSPGEEANVLTAV